MTGSNRNWREQPLQQNVATFLRMALLPPPDGPYWFAPDAGIQAGGKHAARIGGIRKSMGVRAGVPDLVFFWRQPFVIEIKAQAGRLSNAQAADHDDLRSLGVTVYLCRSLDSVIAALDEQGVPLRARALA